jgi:hypothetical protein
MSTVRTGVGIGILLGIVLSALLWAAAQPAHAQTVDECQDALANLQSFRAKVGALEQQGKISSTNAAALISGADGSIACVQGLIDAQAAPAAA